MTIKIEVENLDELRKLLCLMDVLPSLSTAGEPEPVAAPTPVEPVAAPTPVEPIIHPTALTQPVNKLDVNGDEWDERIHSRARTLTKDGLWRTKRKPNDMSEQEWQTFINECKGVDPTPSTPTLPGMEPVQPPQPEPKEITFIDLMNMITKRIDEGRYTTGEMDLIMNRYGVTNVTELMGKDELITTIYNEISK